MWYVIQVSASQESTAKTMIERFVDDDLYEEVFIPRYQVMKHRHGEWVQTTSKLFPGYVIVITNQVEMLNSQVRQVPAFTRLLTTGDTFIPLNPEEIDWIGAFTTKGNRIIEMSEGIIEGDQVIITKGPLKFREGWIKKIDRHKRLAYLEIKLLGRTVDIKVGLGIIRKSL